MWQKTCSSDLGYFGQFSNEFELNEQSMLFVSVFDAFLFYNFTILSQTEWSNDLYFTHCAIEFFYIY